MRHHNSERFDGDNQSYERPQLLHGAHLELNALSSNFISKFHKELQAKIYEQTHHQLPNLELFNGDHQRHSGEQGNSHLGGRDHQGGGQGHHSGGHHGDGQGHNGGGHHGEGQGHHGGGHHGDGQGHHSGRRHHNDHGQRGHHEQYQQNSGEPGAQGQGSDQNRSIYTYDGATRANEGQAMESARIVANVARRMGVDPVAAVAAMLVESGGDPRAVGDHGHSFGLFQLNYRGELAEAHLTPEQAFDPERNAEVALSHFQRGAVADAGVMAAAAQRPANRSECARRVNSNMAEAERMVQALGLA